MTLKEIETIISNPDLASKLDSLKKSYPFRLDSATANSNYKANLRKFSVDVKSAQFVK